MLSCVLILGCGGGDGATTPDARQYDARNIDRTDRVYVVKRYVLPTTPDDVDAAKFVFNGTNDIPVNKLGALTRVQMDLLEGLPVQQDLDANFAAGASPQLFVVNSGPLDGYDDGVTVSFARVEDADADPSNNFGGQGQFVDTDGEAATFDYVTGTLENGQIQAKATYDTVLVFELPFIEGEEPMRVPGRFGRMRVTIDENGFHGYGASGITRQQIHENVYPISARQLTAAIQMDLPRAQDIRDQFDTNNDDEITVEELVANPQMDSLTQPDIDLDDDGELDHVSQAIEWEAVPAELVE